ncbi:MAG TPA: molybdenum cofactor guanylyltransferase [Solirubrobacteraceae bacterium]|jgi:molybdopterin-guanine dinucleotide biosynthesis protein A|nr:molybdenum cofactor guanylyltransferase [Solirubrobacteraceae bacterium]
MSQAPIGVILAGGLGHRLGGAKATVELRGRPLLSYPLAVLREALAEVVIVAKADTELPAGLEGVPVSIEPSLPRHPLTGIVHALGFAAGRAVLVCAADMPFVTPELVTRIAGADPQGAPAVVPLTGEALQPLLALYLPGAFDGRAVDSGRPLRTLVAELGPRLLAVEDGGPFFNVNTREDLRRAEAILGARYPNV